MATLLEKLRQLLRQKIKSERPEMGQTHDRPAARADGSANPVTDGNVQKLMLALEMTREKEYSCEETFALLDEYVEVAVKNEEDAAAVMPLVKHHLNTCPGCHENFEALLRILQTEY